MGPLRPAPAARSFGVAANEVECDSGKRAEGGIEVASWPHAVANSPRHPAAAALAAESLLSVVNGPDVLRSGERPRSARDLARSLSSPELENCHRIILSLCLIESQTRISARHFKEVLVTNPVSFRAFAVASPLLIALSAVRCVDQPGTGGAQAPYGASAPYGQQRYQTMAPGAAAPGYMAGTPPQPAYAPPSGYGSQPGYAPMPGYAPQPGYAGPPGYTSQPGYAPMPYGDLPGYGPQPGASPPPGYVPPSPATPTPASPTPAPTPALPAPGTPPASPGASPGFGGRSISFPLPDARDRPHTRPIGAELGSRYPDRSQSCWRRVPSACRLRTAGGAEHATGGRHRCRQLQRGSDP